MAARRVYTEDEVEDLVAKVLDRKKKKPPTEDVEKELWKQNAAILRGELAREKRERVRAVARNPEATASDKVAALGGESALTPFQLLKLHDSEAPTRPAMAALEPPPADLLRLVLGSRPSSKELARYTDIAEILRGHVTIGPNMSMEVHGEQVPGDLDFLSKAMDLAEKGDHDGAWSSLHFARQARAPRPHLKKAEAYCAQLRDNDDDTHS